MRIHAVRVAMLCGQVPSRDVTLLHATLATMTQRATRQNISSGGPYEAPYGYSRAVRIGDQIHVAGTCAQPPNVDGVDAYGQAVDALMTISAALTDAGASVADVVRTRLYVIDIDDTDAVLRAHGEVFGEIRPAATLVQVVALIDPQLRVEIEAYAVVSE